MSETAIAADTFFPISVRFLVCAKEPEIGWRVRRILEYDEYGAAIDFARRQADRKYAPPIRVLATTGEIVYEVDRAELNRLRCSRFFAPRTSR